MCNAFTHRKSCKCGFGHDGLMRYSNYYDEALGSELHLLANNYLASSFGPRTIPNYQCSCCGAKIFFFQSSSGGKVLFDSLGKPWPKHDCLGMTYQKKKDKLKISPNEWWQISDLSATPSPTKSHSIFSGVIPSNVGDSQNRVELEARIEELILVKDIYVDAKEGRIQGDVFELLVLLDDGRHELRNAELIKIEPFKMQDLSDRMPYLIQPKLV